MLFLVMAAFTLIVPLSGFAAISKNQVTYKNGLVSIEARNEKLEDLLNEIAEVLSIKVYLYDNSGRDDVTVSLHDCEPVEALRSVLRNRNYSIIFNDEQGEAGVERLYGLNSKVENRSGRSRSSAGQRSTSGNTANNSAGRTSRTESGGNSKGTMRAAAGSTAGGARAEASRNESSRYLSSKTGNNETQTLSVQDDGTENLEWDETGYWEDEGESESSQQGSKEDDSYWESDEDSYDTDDFDPRASEIALLENRIEDIQQQIDSGEADLWYEKWSEIRGDRYVTHPEVTMARLENKLNDLLDGNS